jgi:signal transduction histidine kinase/ActR/RegA family two-component response regulator
MNTTLSPPPHRALRSQDDFFSLVERNVDGILVIDPLGHILYANRSAARMLGRSAEELRGELFGVPICPDETSDIVLHGRRGETRFAEMRLVDFRWDGRSALLATLRDVTERKRMQEEADEAVKLRDQFLAMLSHELRNPVGAISNAARVIERAQGNRDLTLQAAEVVTRQARQMGRLLDDLLDVTRVTRGLIELQWQSVDFASVVANAIDSAGPIIAMRGHKLTVECPPGKHFVYGDPARLQQILDNLLTNSAKYTPDGGQIELAVEGTADEIVVLVRDSGVGIPEAIRKRIFDLFVQADDTLDRARGGLGIGLTLVRMLVEMHQGCVAVDNRGASPGSEFTIRLPRGTRPERRELAEPPPWHAADVGTVMLVDDNVDARAMLQTYLELHGYRVTVAADGQEAVEAILRERPQVAVVDIGLPKLNGYEVAAQLREVLKKDCLRLIALTGYGQFSDRKKAFAAGFDEHLVKPVDMDRLMRVIDADAWRSRE